MDELDPLGFETQEWPFYWLTRATGLYLSRLERSLKAEGLDVARYRVLMCVRPGQARSIGEIAELAIVKLPTMLKIVQRMQADGLVLARPREEDGRFTDVTLTSAGVDARQRVWHMAHSIYEKAFSGDTPPDRVTVNEQMARIVARLSD
ncbi:MarR family winged helix-turn-helix transcriptional regulator [Novosphingobium rosa]|uniref:MarR family winged helix-turn-helix transcriptional regulator n=1 Tax=Novosphingobium rosa TaxID=76978 RepID=UPI00082EDADB|nr:MarR family winged helix-turn-helix transcriptional regulator [Novosphingobium rosa]